MKKKYTDNEKGITLIALGITIIILLILAGVTTSKLDEMNGIIKQAQDTKEFVESVDSEETQEINSTNRDAMSYILK